jgi:hypothetical protein
MKIKEKELARVLRKQGKSINQIIKETGFTKSSISVWVRDIILTDKQKNKISERGRSMESIEKRRISRLANEHKKRRFIIDEAKKDFKNISLKELKLIGIMLYWGEGGKTGNWSVRLANSDPAIIQIMMRFFREVCMVKNNKFHGHIHTFENADVEKTEKYWSKISRIPRDHFYKTYIKPSVASLQKRKTLPFGTVDIYVNNTKLFLTIIGWIEKIKEILVEKIK